FRSITSGVPNTDWSSDEGYVDSADELPALVSDSSEGDLPQHTTSHTQSPAQSMRFIRRAIYLGNTANTDRPTKCQPVGNVAIKCC
ncbi:hypothetical protein SARC_07442, partial [Sphaeroforma arctica JP610]